MDSELYLVLIIIVAYILLFGGIYFLLERSLPDEDDE